MNEIQVFKSLKDQLDEIDRRVYDEVYDGFYESRLRILIGMWEKGEVIDGEFRGVNSPSYRQLEKETKRDHKSLKQWHDIYSDYPDRSEYEEIAELKAREWADKALKPKGVKQLEESGWLKIYDIWNFQGLDERFGIEYPGNIPAGIILNILYYFTEENDLVVDPMAGGGVTIDCCKYLKRKCLAYDIQPARKDIKSNDVLKGYPLEAENCDLIFLDPPYYKKKEEEYGEKSISFLPKNDYLKTFDLIAKNSLKIIKPNKFLAFLMEPYIDYENSQESIWLYEYINRFIKEGWNLERIFDVPESSQRYQAHDVNRAKEKKQILTLRRQLVIFKK